jgi:hypothetical protein
MTAHRMRKLFPNRLSFENAGGPKWTLDLKTRVLTMLVVLTDVSGNFTMSWGLKHQSAVFGISPLVYLRLIFDPWVVLGTTLLLIWFLSRTILPGWADLSSVLPVTSFSYVFTKSHRSLEGRFPKSRDGLTGGAGRRW